MFSTSFTVADRIIKAKVTLNKERPFFSYILMNFNIEQSKSEKEIPTMGVNKYGRLYWNEDFVKKLSQDELEAVLAHEALHVATLTFSRQDKRAHMLWNIATDAVINNILMEENFHLPKDCILPHGGQLEFEGKNGKIKIQIAGRTAEQVYDEMLNNCEIIRINLSCGGKDDDQDSKGKYKGQLDVHIDGDKDSEGNSTGDEKSQASSKANDEKWKKKATEAATAARNRGTISNNLERELQGILEPKIDWRKMLYIFMTKDIPIDFTMRRPGRRFYTTGVYYPSIVRENLEIVCLCDNSGSIDYSSAKGEGAQFISEAVGIADAFPQLKMRFIWWSTEVDDRDDIEVNKSTKGKLIKHQPHGGGGTELSCCVPYLRKKNIKSKVYVVLTDGYIENEPKLPAGNILFVLSKGGSDSIVKKYGKCCSLGDVEQD